MNREQCPMCRGEKIVGVIASKNERPPELATCPKCEGVGTLPKADGLPANEVR